MTGCTALKYQAVRSDGVESVLGRESMATTGVECGETTVPKFSGCCGDGFFVHSPPA
jgi:hypothetical protein